MFLQETLLPDGVESTPCPVQQAIMERWILARETAADCLLAAQSAEHVLEVRCSSIGTTRTPAVRSSSARSRLTGPFAFPFNIGLSIADQSPNPTHVLLASAVMRPPYIYLR